MTNIFRIITTTPCPKCDATKRQFKKFGIPFESVAKEDAADDVEEARASGATSFPIVIAPDGSWWSDFQNDRIKAWGLSQAWREEKDDEHREPVE